MKLNVVKRVLIFIPTAFLFLHLSSLPYIIIENVYDRPYFNAKLNLSISQFLNESYLIPIGQMMGAYSFPTNSVRGLRDHFYNVGVDALPEDEVERVIWHSKIISKEYVELQKKEMGKQIYDGSIVETRHLYEPYYKNQIKMINKLFELGPLEDKIFQKKRYFAAITDSINFISNWPFVYSMRRGKMNEIINCYPYMKIE